MTRLLCSPLLPEWFLAGALVLGCLLLLVLATRPAGGRR